MMQPADPFLGSRYRSFTQI